MRRRPTGPPTHALALKSFSELALSASRAVEGRLGRLVGREISPPAGASSFSDCATLDADQLSVALGVLIRVHEAEAKGFSPAGREDGKRRGARPAARSPHVQGVRDNPQRECPVTPDESEQRHEPVIYEKAMTAGVTASASVQKTVERGLTELRLAVLGIVLTIALSVGFGTPASWPIRIACGVLAIAVVCALIRWNASRKRAMRFAACLLRE
jgi:hypothetical protein